MKAGISRLIICALVVVIAGLLAGVTWFGYGRVLDQRALSAVETAADFIKAGRHADELALETSLPPDFVDEARNRDVELLFTYFDPAWELDERDSRDDVVTDTYRQAGGGEQTVEFEAAGSPSLKKATVRAHYRWENAPGQYSDAGESLDLLWIDGAWRVARYDRDASDVELVFYDTDTDVDDLVDAYRAALETAAGSGTTAADDGAPDAQATIPATITEEELAAGSLPEGHPSIGGPDVSTPESYVGSYFTALVNGDYPTAYRLLPADKRAAQDEASFAQQVGAYEVSGYTIDDVSVDRGAGTATVLTSMQCAGGIFQYSWTLEQDAGAWVATARTLPGMQ